jgi:hypothetical protein
MRKIIGVFCYYRKVPRNISQFWKDIINIILIKDSNIKKSSEDESIRNKSR